MATEFQFRYRFHPAGQGVFASGTVCKDLQNAPFHWVVDCGSTAPKEVLRPAVWRYRDLVLDPQPLDLLCISHFDKDHVSGLGDLLQGLHVVRVVIPYYTPVERLMLGLKQSPGDADYIEFLSNPVAYIQERATAVREIIIVSGPNGDTPIDGFYDDRPPRLPGGVLEEDAPPQNEDWRVKFPESNVTRIGDDFPLNEATREFAARCGTQILTAPGSFMALASPTTGGDAMWEFLFFHKPIDPGVIAELILKLDAALKRRPSPPGRTQLVFNLLNNNERSQLKHVFASTLKGKENINSTSLCVYSGPYTEEDAVQTLISDPFPDSLIGSWPDPANCGYLECSILYTGDANLKPEENRRELFDFLSDPRWGTTYLPRRQRIVIFQVPHHGSRNNWESGASAEFGHQYSVFCADEHHRKYKHPHREVLLDFQYRGPLLANKHQGWSWRGLAHFP